jgi:hypothetical protein
MRRWFALSCLVLTAAVSSVRADIPPGPHVWPPLPAPPNAPPAVVPIVVEPASGDDRQTHLQLPGSLLKQLRVSANVIEAAPRGWGPTPTGTVVAGVAISVAMVLGGLSMIRRPTRRWIGASVTAATVAVVIGLGGCIPGRVPPWMVHGEEETLSRLKPKADGALAGQALLEVGETDDNARLTIDREDLAVWAAKAASQPVDNAGDSGSTKK